MKNILILLMLGAMSLGAMGNKCDREEQAKEELRHQRVTDEEAMANDERRQRRQSEDADAEDGHDMDADMGDGMDGDMNQGSGNDLGGDDDTY